MKFSIYEDTALLLMGPVALGITMYRSYNHHKIATLEDRIANGMSTYVCYAALGVLWPISLPIAIASYAGTHK